MCLEAGEGCGFGQCNADLECVCDPGWTQGPQLGDGLVICDFHPRVVFTLWEINFILLNIRFVFFVFNQYFVHLDRNRKRRPRRMALFFQFFTILSQYLMTCLALFGERRLFEDLLLTIFAGSWSLSVLSTVTMVSLKVVEYTFNKLQALESSKGACTRNTEIKATTGFFGKMHETARRFRIRLLLNTSAKLEVGLFLVVHVYPFILLAVWGNPFKAYRSYFLCLGLIGLWLIVKLRYATQTMLMDIQQLLLCEEHVFGNEKGDPKREAFRRRIHAVRARRRGIARISTPIFIFIAVFNTTVAIFPTVQRMTAYSFILTSISSLIGEAYLEGSNAIRNARKLRYGNNTRSVQMMNSSAKVASSSM